MSIKSITGITVLIAIFMMGCSGNNANIKTQSQSESKFTQQDLLDNWSDYDINYNKVVIVFDPQKSDKKVLVDNSMITVKNQDAWTQLVNGTNKMPSGGINQVWGEPIREIWVNNQFYGYVSHSPREIISAKIVDENTVRLWHIMSLNRRNLN